MYARPFCSPATIKCKYARWECRGTTHFYHRSGNKNRTATLIVAKITDCITKMNAYD